MFNMNMNMNVNNMNNHLGTTNLVHTLCQIKPVQIPIFHLFKENIFILFCHLGPGSTSLTRLDYKFLCA